MKAIYGAGRYGKLLFEYLSKHGIHIDLFCQTKKDDRKDFCGLPLISFEDLIRRVDVSIVLIGIFDRAESRKVKENILDLAKSEINVVECGELIRWNLTSEKAFPITYASHNTYEEGVTQSYWKEYFADEDRLCVAIKELKYGMKKLDALKIDNIVNRMRLLPFAEEENDIFSPEEKVQIRRVEREFRPEIVHVSDIRGVYGGGAATSFQ